MARSSGAFFAQPASMAHSTDISTQRAVRITFLSALEAPEKIGLGP
jgi:hypothetical protein